MPMHEFGATLWRASWQGALAILVVGLLIRGAKERLPADFRAWLWRLTYVKLLAALIFPGALVCLSLPLPKATPAPDISASVAPEAMLTTTPPRESLAAPAAPATPEAEQSVSVEATPAPVPVVAWAPDAVTGIVLLYLGGVALCLARLIQSGRTLYRAVRIADTSAVSLELRAEAAHLASRIGLRSLPRLARTTAESTLPVPLLAFGTVLMSDAARFTPAEERMVLAHELAHARRRDLAWDWLGALVQVLFFFHPLVHIARREERLARESAADALALQAVGVAPAEYGAMLLAAALGLSAGVPTTTALAVGMAERGTVLERRLAALKEKRNMSVKRYVMAAGLTALVGAAVVIPWQITRASALKTPSASFPEGIIARTGNDSPAPSPASAGIGRITGRFTDKADHPHVGMRIWYRRVPDLVGDEPYQALTGSVVTDQTGRYTIPYLAPGRYEILYYWYDAAEPTRVMERRSLLLSPGQKERVWDEVIYLEESPDGRGRHAGPRSPFTMSFGEGFSSFSGYKVRFAGMITGRIVSPAGEPL